MADREDEAFRRKVAAEFARARDRACERGFSVEDFVRKIGITRAALNKYINGKSIPRLRVLQKARKYWGVRLSYGELGDTYIKAKKADPKQARFEFDLGEISKEQIEIKR